MTRSYDQSLGARFLLHAAAFVVVIAGVRAAEPIVVPFLVAVFLAIIAGPSVFWLERRGLPAVLAVLLVVLGLMTMLVGIGALLGTTINNFVRAVPEYQARLQQALLPLLNWLQSHGVTVSRSIVLDYVNPGEVILLLARTLTNLGGVLTNTFLILLTVIFMLLEASSFPIKLRLILPEPHRSLDDFSRILDDVNRYLAIKTWISLATGGIIFLWVSWLGLDFPLLWGLLAFVLNYVPNLGSIIAALPAVLLGFIQFGLGQALLVALGYVVVNTVFGNVLEPRWMGRRLGLSTLVVFLSLVFWGWVLGPVGMLLSVPLTMTVRIAVEASDDSRWLAVLLGPEVLGKTIPTPTLTPIPPPLTEPAAPTSSPTGQAET